MSRRRLSRDERRELVEMRLSERRGGPSTSVVYATPPANVVGLRQRRMIRIVDAGWAPTSSGGTARFERYQLTDHGRVVADQLILQAYKRRVYVSGSDGSFGEAMAWKQNPELAFYVARVRDRFELRFAGRLGLLAWPAPERSLDPSPAELGMAPPRGEPCDAYLAIRRRALETRQLAKGYSFGDRHPPMGVRVLRQAAMSMNFGHPPPCPALRTFDDRDPGDEDRRGDHAFCLDRAAETREGEQT